MSFAFNYYAEHIQNSIPMAIEGRAMHFLITTHLSLHPLLINLRKGNLTIPVYDVYKPNTLLE
jgi:hypothetical protein